LPHAAPSTAIPGSPSPRAARNAANPGTPSPPPRAASSTSKPGAAQPPTQPTGKVVHDERGNAVWDWLKETSRIAIESTTRLLRKLESPELKVEDTHEEQLRIMPDHGKCAGGGYDPYNQANKGRKPGK
jgi:hypothetical protein